MVADVTCQKQRSELKLSSTMVGNREMACKWCWRRIWYSQHGLDLNNCPPMTQCVIVVGHIRHQFYHLTIILINSIAHSVQNEFCQIIYVGTPGRTIP